MCALPPNPLPQPKKKNSKNKHVRACKPAVKEQPVPCLMIAGEDITFLVVQAKMRLKVKLNLCLCLTKTCPKLLT